MHQVGNVLLAGDTIVGPSGARRRYPHEAG
jgi:hypothetical protein